MTMHSSLSSMVYQIQGLQMEVSKLTGSTSYPLSGLQQTLSAMQTQMAAFMGAINSASSSINFSMNSLIANVAKIQQIAEDPDFKRAVDDIREFNDRFDDEFKGE